MFKRSLVAVTVVAVVSGTVVAPANAMTVTVNKDMTCTIKQTDEEASYTRLDPTVKATKEIATRLKADYVEGFLSTIRPEIEKLKQKLADPDLAEAMKKDLAGQLEKKEKSFTAMKNFSNALDACIDGRDYDSSKPEGPSNPGPSKPEGPSNPGPSKPEGPSNPERERALPSTNGAVIGVIVAVLGILVAALPVIKSMLPAQLRALLP
ncbi:hypothetical protein FRC0378_02021 [Corynebacterium diphtheriae]|nr:hypothetical protein FRC0378_02021 [Corynebacterium diphtheriae]